MLGCKVILLPAMCTPFPSWVATTAPITLNIASLAEVPLQSKATCTYCAALTLSDLRVGALYHCPNVVGLPWALLCRPGNIVLAGALLISSGIIGLAHSPLHCPDHIIGLTGALLLRSDFIGLAAGALHVLHRPGIHWLSAGLTHDRACPTTNDCIECRCTYAYMRVQRTIEIAITTFQQHLAPIIIREIGNGSIGRSTMSKHQSITCAIS
jgi:hypothetical protein